MRSRYIVAYDIREPKRLRRVHTAMRGFGDALQYSVFSCDLSDKEKVLMFARLGEIIHHRVDRVMIVDLGPTDGRGARCFEFLGDGSPPPLDRAVIV